MVASKAIVESPVRSVIRSPVGGLLGNSGTNYLSNTLLTTTAGTDASPVSGNQITIPAGYDSLAVWVGSFTEEEIAYLSISVRVNSTTTILRAINRHWYVIRCAAGDVVSFASQKKTGAAVALANQSVTLSVCPMLQPSTLVSPTAVSGTANCDKAGPPIWSPTGTPHIVQTAENLTFTITSASGRREIFMVEKDGSGALCPYRHIHVPDSQAVTVQMRHREAYLATYDGSTVAIQGPAGCTIGGTSGTYRPAFTAVRTVNVANTSQFDTAMLDAADGDDIVMAAGTYNFSSKPVNSGNYTQAFARNIRIRGSAGDTTSTVITGASFGQGTLIADGKRWVLESLRFDYSGVTVATGLVDLGGRWDIHNFSLVGPAAVGAASLSMRSSNTYTSPIVNYATFGTVENATEDSLDTDQTSGGQSITMHAIGLSVNGNGPNANDQLVTSHNGSIIHSWGCAFSDAANGNQPKFAPDGSSKIFFSYCKALAADITNSDGIAMDSGFPAETALFCNFEALKINAFRHHTTGSRMLQKVATGIRFLQNQITGSFATHQGGIFRASANSSCDATDFRRSSEIWGCLIQSQGANNALNPSAANPSAASVLTIGNVYFLAANPVVAFNLNAHANMAGSLTNIIFDASTSQGSFVLGATGGSWTTENSYYRRTNTPTNWDTRFPSQSWAGITAGTASGNNNGTSAPGVDANYKPTAGGNCDTEGKNPGWVGGLDIYGRPMWLGGSFVRGCVELQEIRVGALLFPSQW